MGGNTCESDGNVGLLQRSICRTHTSAPGRKRATRWLPRALAAMLCYGARFGGSIQVRPFNMFKAA